MHVGDLAPSQLISHAPGSSLCPAPQPCLGGHVVQGSDTRHGPLPEGDKERRYACQLRSAATGLGSSLQCKLLPSLQARLSSKQVPKPKSPNRPPPDPAQLTVWC